MTVTRRVALLGLSALALDGCLRHVVFHGRVVDGIIAVPVAQLSGLGPRDALIVRGGPGPIVVRRKADGTTSAVLGICTHNRCELDPGPEGLDCPCHGSSFNFEGRAIIGPAEGALVRFDARVEGDTLLIDVSQGRS